MAVLLHTSRIVAIKNKPNRQLGESQLFFIFDFLYFCLDIEKEEFCLWLSQQI
jgi:hypothetical protein